MLASTVIAITMEKKGKLLGRSNVRLQTSVGLTVVINKNTGNMCVVIMFSPNHVPHSQMALEYLQFISRSTTLITNNSLIKAAQEDDKRDNNLGSIVMGNDSSPDREINRFSTLGWLAVASSLAICQTKLTLRDTVCVFIKSLKEASKKASYEQTAAYEKLCKTIGIDGIAVPTIPSTPPPKRLQNNKKD